MRILLTIAMVLASGAYSFAWAADMDEPQLTGDDRIKMLMYDEADVYTITTKYGYQTNIVFAPQEEIETISVGDRSLWQIIPAANRLFIRPMEDDITTNMTVLTNKRSYQFDLKSLPADKSDGNIYVAKFMYKDARPKPPVTLMVPPAPPVIIAAPQNQGPVTSPFAMAPSVPENFQPVTAEPMVPPAPAVHQSEQSPPAEAAITPQLPPVSAASAAAPNYNYTYTGPDEMAPLQVYDDGKYTYLKYSQQRPLDGILVLDPAGRETPVRYAVRGEFVRVDAVAGEMVVKGGGGSLHIYNETLNPR